MLLYLLVTCLTSFAQSGYGPETVINFSGYISVHGNSQQLFYWFFESRNDPTTDPLIVWVSGVPGNPGCSSMLSLVVENGPYYITDNLEMVLNNNSWNTQANILFIDQPSNTGYSFHKNGSEYRVYTSSDAAVDFYEFIQTFLTNNPKYSKNPFYISGESYAGHFVPAFANKIMSEESSINLMGVAIGNGIVDALYQYSQWPKYGYDYQLLTEFHYNVMSDTMYVCLGATEVCQQNGGSPANAVFCAEAFALCEIIGVGPIYGPNNVNNLNVNPYDIRQKCDHNFTFCYDFTNEEKFFNLGSTKQGLGAADNQTWQMCDAKVSTAMSGEWVLDFRSDITKLLNNNINVLIYSGEYDYMLNWYGTYNWLNNLDSWSGINNWKSASNNSWIIDNEKVGWSKTYNELTFLQIYNAGHLVPMDQPYYAYNMILQFTKEGGW